MNITKIIEEEILNLGEDYPSSFDFDYFKSLTSFKKRIEYCEQHLQRINSGSSRIVYKVDNQKVLKLAKNNKGIAQNEVEEDYSKDMFLMGLFAEVYDTHPQYHWIESELATKLTKPIFKSIVGISFNDFIDIILYEGYTAAKIRQRPNTPKIDTDDYYDNDFIKSVIDYIHNYDIPVGDLTRTSTYGVVNNNDIIMVDYGLTSDVYDSYYS